MSVHQTRKLVLLWIATILGGLCLASCSRPQTTLSPFVETPIVAVTATPTEAFISPVIPPPTTVFISPVIPSPSPTATPPPTPTWTPNPTFTPIPTPALPSEAARPAGWPLLPASLYFIRDGGLWCWPQAGETLEQVVAPPPGYESLDAKAASMAGVTAYRLTADERFIVFKDEELIVLDHTTGISTTVPTVGDLAIPSPFQASFDITPDGRYVIYVAWGVLPMTLSRNAGLNSPIKQAKEGYYGTILAVDVQNPNHEFELGYCAARAEGEWRIGCTGFALSPDGKQIAFADGRGVWLSDLPQGPPRLLVSHPFPNSYSCEVVFTPNWSPDGQWLLLDIGCFEGSSRAVMNVRIGEMSYLPDTFCYVGCQADVVWSSNGHELAATNAGWEAGRVFLLDAQNPPQTTFVFTDTLTDESPGMLIPTAPHFLADGRIGFASQPCIGASGPKPGIYTVRRDGSQLTLASPLPAAFCYQGDWFGATGQVLWSHDGSAFLYIELDDPQKGPWAYRPTLLGLTDSSTLWDVRELLTGARDFHWATSLR